MKMLLTLRETSKIVEEIAGEEWISKVGKKVTRKLRIAKTESGWFDCNPPAASCRITSALFN